MIIVFNTELIGVLFQGHPDRPRCQWFIGVIVAPHGIDGVQIGRSDGAVSFQPNISFRTHEQQYIVGLPFGFHSVILGAITFGKTVVVVDQTSQAFQAPEEDPLNFGTEVVRQKRIVLTVKRFLLNGQDQLSAVESIRMVVERFQITIGERQKADVHCSPLRSKSMGISAVISDLR